MEETLDTSPLEAPLYPPPSAVVSRTSLLVMQDLELQPLVMKVHPRPKPQAPSPQVAPLPRPLSDCLVYDLQRIVKLCLEAKGPSQEGPRERR